MKLKVLLLGALAFVAALTASAKDEYSTDPAVLPTQARELIQTTFGKNSVNHIKIDKDLFGVDGYDVILSNGTEVEFDSKGRLKEVSCNREGRVPDKLIMKSIRDYVAKNYKGQNIVKYDVKRNGYEVELRSGLELEFDSAGQFKRIDR